ncbi:MAG: hypothetical protein IKJ30_06055 [Bacilli bacterium]|nr:hypothetical protein [Bacilli bacterium]
MDSKEIKQKKSTSKIIKETVKKVSDKTKVKETAKKVTSKSKKEIESTGLEAPKKLKILVTIVERSKSDFYLSALEGFDVNMQTLVYAKGTASKEIAGLVGLNDDNKAMILSIVKEEKIKEILATYEDKYFKTKRGKGVAFTIPISSVIGVMVYKFLLNVNEG